VYTPSLDTLEKRINMFSRGMRCLLKRATISIEQKFIVFSSFSPSFFSPAHPIHFNCISNFPLTAIVHLVETVVGLGTDISKLDSSERLVIVQRSQGDHKDMCTVVLTLDKQSSLKNAMC